MANGGMRLAISMYEKVINYNYTPTIKEVAKLQQKKYRDDSKKFLLEGLCQFLNMKLRSQLLRLVQFYLTFH